MIRLILEFSDTGKSINFKANQEDAFASQRPNAKAVGLVRETNQVRAD